MLEIRSLARYRSAFSTGWTFNGTKKSTRALSIVVKFNSSYLNKETPYQIGKSSIWEEQHGYDLVVLLSWNFALTLRWSHYPA